MRLEKNKLIKKWLKIEIKIIRTKFEKKIKKIKWAKIKSKIKSN
jgi:hypothetical protein